MSYTPYQEESRFNGTYCYCHACGEPIVGYYSEFCPHCSASSFILERNLERYGYNDRNSATPWYRPDGY